MSGCQIIIGLYCCHLHGKQSRKKFFLNCLTLEDEGTSYFETSGTTHPGVKYHILEDLNSQKHHCENLDPMTEILSEQYVL